MCLRRIGPHLKLMSVRERVLYSLYPLRVGSLSIYFNKTFVAGYDLLIRFEPRIVLSLTVVR
jgi:hypothetical protein